MNISSLSDSEYVRLVANYTSISGLSDDGAVSTELANRGYTAEQLATVKKSKANKFSAVQSCNLKFTKPFDHLTFDSLNYVLNLFENYERGCLPFSGSTSEQPAQIMEIFSVLRQLKQEIEIKLREKYQANGRNKHQNNSRASR